MAFKHFSYCIKIERSTFDGVKAMLYKADMVPSYADALDGEALDLSISSLVPPLFLVAGV